MAMLPSSQQTMIKWGALVSLCAQLCRHKFCRKTRRACSNDGTNTYTWNTRLYTYNIEKKDNMVRSKRFHEFSASYAPMYLCLRVCVCISVCIVEAILVCLVYCIKYLSLSLFLFVLSFVGQQAQNLWTLTAQQHHRQRLQKPFHGSDNLATSALPRFFGFCTIPLGSYALAL